MATAVVSGAAALLLDARPELTPAQLKAALQLTASRVPGAGLIEAGAGSVNVAAAVAMVKGRTAVRNATAIANEIIRPFGISYVDASPGSSRLLARIIVWGDTFLPITSVSTQTVWFVESLVGGELTPPESTRVDFEILVWGDAVTADILVWGNILVWENSVSPDILVWGDTDVFSDILVWGD